jgi:AcrB/AcrD/AcrF family
VLAGSWSLRRIPLDALPDISDVQVIIRTRWAGQPPSLIEDQVTYPIVTKLLAAPHVKAVRAQTMLGDSYVFVVFIGRAAGERPSGYWPGCDRRRMIRTKGDRAEIANLDGSSVRLANANNPNRESCIPLRPFQALVADFIRAGSDHFDDGRKRNAVSAKFVGIDINLVLLDESDGRDFGNARNGFKLVAQIPVLNAAQLGEAALMRTVHENVFYPRRCGRVAGRGRNRRGHRRLA